MKKTPPTKEQVKDARAKIRESRKVLAAALKKRRGGRRFVRRHPSAERDFYTWQHDFQTVLESTAKELGTPVEIVDRAAQAADRMREIIEARRPVETGPTVYRRRSRRSRSEPDRRWHEWQGLFDTLLHVLVEKTDVPVGWILQRAQDIADAAQEVTDKRRPKRRSVARAA
jgi:hypothetical protein